VNNPGENVPSCQYHRQHRQDSHRALAVLAMLPMSSWKKNATQGLGSGNAMSPLVRPDVKSSAAIVGMSSIGFMDSSNLVLNLTPSTTSSRPERDLPKSAKIEIMIY